MSLLVGEASLLCCWIVLSAIIAFMAHRDLLSLIAEGEHQSLEFKSGAPSDLRRHIAGMANAAGGTILLGVKDDGSVVGFKLTDKVWRSILGEANACEPPVRVNVGQWDEVVQIEVFESEDKLVTIDNGIYLRDGPTTRKMRAREVKKFLEEYMPPQFDSHLVYGFSYPDDMDWKKYTDWADKANFRHAREPSDVLLELGAAVERTEGLVLTNAAVLLFASKPEKFIPHSYITCALFNGDNGSSVLDRKDIYGGLLQCIDETIFYLKKNMRVAYRRTNGRAQREEIGEYSLTAVREAVVNAVLHRDWSMTGANISLKLFHDHLEIQSPGGLPKGITLETLGTRSSRRNPLLADIMARAGVGEKMGTGISYIRRESILHGSGEPKFEDNGFFSVVFSPHPETVRSNSPK